LRRRRERNSRRKLRDPNRHKTGNGNQNNRVVVGRSGQSDRNARSARSDKIVSVVVIGNAEIVVVTVSGRRVASDRRHDVVVPRKVADGRKRAVDDRTKASTETKKTAGDPPRAANKLSRVASGL